MLRKKDIKLGDIILIRKGFYYIYVETPTFDFPVFCRFEGYLKGLGNYTDDLQFNHRNSAYRDFDIIKVFKPKLGYVPIRSVNQDCWDFPIKISSVFANYREITDISDLKKDEHFINLLEYV